MIYEQEVSIFREDALRNKFSSIQTNFDVTLGKISAIISDSDIEEYISGGTTMNSRLSSTVQDLDGFHTQVSAMKTDFDGQFTDVESRLTQIDTTVHGITASVSSVQNGKMVGDTLHFLATSVNSGVTVTTPGWSTSFQQVTQSNPYLWIYHTYSYSDQTTFNTTPVVIHTYAVDGAVLSNVSALHYVGNSATPPSAPTAKVTTTSTDRGIWTKGIADPDHTYIYMYVCDQLEYNGGTVAWTGVVCNNSFADLTNRVSAAELKITDSAIISTVYNTSSTEANNGIKSMIEQTPNTIRFTANHLAWNSTYSSMTETGVLTAREVHLTGEITATSGYIGSQSSGFHITSDAIYNGISSVGATSGTGIYVGTEGINLGGGRFKVTKYGVANLTGATISGALTITNNSSYCAFEGLTYAAQIAQQINGGHDAFRLCDDASKSDALGYGAYLIVDKWDTSYRFATINRSKANVVVALHALVTGVYTNPTRLVHYLSPDSFSFQLTNGTSTYASLTAGNSSFSVSGPYSFTVTTAGAWVNGNKVQTSSSKRYKHDIELMTNREFDPHKLLNLVPKQFVYNDGEEQYQDTKGMTIPGFIAEDVADIYPSAVIHNQKGEIESWDERRIIPAMLSLIQELYKRIERLEDKAYVPSR